MEGGEYRQTKQGVEIHGQWLDTVDDLNFVQS